MNNDPIRYTIHHSWSTLHVPYVVVGGQTTAELIKQLVEDVDMAMGQALNQRARRSLS